MNERIEKYCYTKKDFNIDWFSGTGPGGQNRNKVQACVRITHIPSGLKVVGQTERTRASNFRKAFNRLGKMIEDWVKVQIAAETVGRITSDERIRTYHIADNWVKDHASNHTIPASALDKKFGELIDARRLSILTGGRE